MTLTALLIGNESLTVECGKRWLERGHTLAAVVTREARVATWASAAGLRVILPGAGLEARTAGLAVDWILSVANLAVVPARSWHSPVRVGSTSTTARCRAMPVSTLRSGRC